jgi:hypothetical protein
MHFTEVFINMPRNRFRKQWRHGIADLRVILDSRPEELMPIRKRLYAGALARTEESMLIRMN